MLSQLPPFCNSFPEHAISAWQGAWNSGRCRGDPHRVAVVWSTLDLASPGLIPPYLHAGSTPIHLSISNPHIIRTYSPTKCSAACMWRTPLAISLFKHDTSIRRQHPHSLARAAACLYTPGCSAAIIPEHRSMVRLLWGYDRYKGDLGRGSRGFGETLQGIWGDAPGDLGRRKMRQY